MTEGARLALSVLRQSVAPAGLVTARSVPGSVGGEERDLSAAVLVQDWRSAAERQGLRGEEFDRAAWELIDSRRVRAHHHPRPWTDASRPKWLQRQGLWFHVVTVER